MALTATITTIPAQVVENQPFVIQAAVANSGSSTNLVAAVARVNGSVPHRTGHVATNPQVKTSLAGSATTYIAWTSVIFGSPKPYGGAVSIDVRVDGADGSAAIATGTVTVVPRVMPPIKFGPFLDLRFFENSQNVSLL